MWDKRAVRPDRDAVRLGAQRSRNGALPYDTQARPGLAGTRNGICPAQNDGTQQGGCVSPSWWLTPQQTGFEIWDLPADRGASQSGALGTTPLAATPLSAPANDPNGATGRARADNRATIMPTMNPETTDANGSFRRDVRPGSFDVRADGPGCTSVTTAARPVLTGRSGTAPTGGGEDGLPVCVVVRPPGIPQRACSTGITGALRERTTAPGAALSTRPGTWLTRRWAARRTTSTRTRTTREPQMLQPGASTFSAEPSAVP